MGISYRKYLSFLVGLLVMITFSFKVVVASIAIAKESTSVNANEKTDADDDQDFDIDKKLDSSIKVKMFPDEWNHTHPMHVIAFFTNNFVKSYFEYLNIQCSEPVITIETPPPNFTA